MHSRVPGSQELRSLIDVDRLCQSLLDLIRIPSVNPFGARAVGQLGEVDVAEYLGKRLSALGWEQTLQEYDARRANLLSTAPGAGADRPGVVFAGHLDTVEVVDYANPFAGHLTDERIYGRGACDMKAALACYLEVAEVLAGLDIELLGPLAVAGVADEEFCQEGAKNISRLLPETDLVVIGEPTELRICSASKGLAAYTLRTDGIATHGSVPGAGRNAILQAARLALAVERHADELRAVEHPLLGPPVLNIGVVRGGTKPNVVPPSAELDLSRRLLPGETPRAAREQLRAALKGEFADLDWDLSAAWWAVDPYENRNDEVVSAFRASAQRQNLANADTTGFLASSDAAYFGPPVVIFGPGSLNQAHSLDEWVPISDMVTATAVYLQFVLDHLTDGVARPDQKDRS